MTYDTRSLQMTVCEVPGLNRPKGQIDNNLSEVHDTKRALKTVQSNLNHML